MYANRYAGSRGFKPAGLGASLLVNGAILLGLVYAAPHVISAPTESIDVRLIPLDQPPPPMPQPRSQPHAARTLAAPQPFMPPPRMTTPTDEPPISVTSILPPPGPVDLGDGTVAPPQPTPLSALIGAAVDARYADAFQPPYPPAERRAGNEGRVVVRVLIGVDGRVKQVEKVSAASDAFFATTRDQALAKWRFKPATRGDVPVESWKTMTVRFVLQDE